MIFICIENNEILCSSVPFLSNLTSCCTRQPDLNIANFLVTILIEDDLETILRYKGSNLMSISMDLFIPKCTSISKLMILCSLSKHVN